VSGQPRRTSAPAERILHLLEHGEMEILGLLPYASNATLLARITDGDLEGLGVYKPRRGERPLWDFPSGTLCLREYAASVVDRALGWELVPPTVLRDGPAGFGAVQLFIEEDESCDPRELLGARPDDLRRVALFDVLINNADRKAGHMLVDTSGHLWSVDHGICFHDEPKLRTVIWAFEGDELPPDLVRDVERLRGDANIIHELSELLGSDEVDAFCRRIDRVLGTRCYPSPGPGGHHVPWPPW
jgi:uncharacterized repeat protein (TIGR03843 family)